MKKLVLIMKVLLIVVVAGVAGAGVYIHSGSYDVAADTEHHPLTHWVLRTTRRHSIAARDKHVEARLPVLTTEMRHDAVIGYEDMCAGCHAPPGRNPSALERGLNPSPSDLTRAAMRYTPSKLFWVTKHGIKMSGMPAWGVTHSDEVLWELVALLQEFPGMEGDDYERLLAETRAAGVEHVHDQHHQH